jgi:hypothetical protein
VAQQPNAGQGRLIFEVSRSHTMTPADCRDLYWQQTTLTTDIHATGEIRTHEPSKRSAANPRLKPFGHWNKQFHILEALFLPNWIKIRNLIQSLISGSLSPTRVLRLWVEERSPDMEGSCVYIKQAAAYSRQGVILQLGSWTRSSRQGGREEVRTGL